MTTSDREHWLHRFARLRVDPDKGLGRAPHKPLLLLAVLDQLEQGQLANRWVVRSPDLVVRFQNLWPIVEERRRNKGDIRLPFHALATDGVWRVFDDARKPSRARETSTCAEIAADLLTLLRDSAFRIELRQILISSYFSLHEQVALYAAIGHEKELFALEEAAAVQEQQATYRLAKETGRSARFKTQVVTRYQFTCALTGYRLTTIDQTGIVEAAHIHAHAESRNNDPSNGLALSPTAHVLFDLGLWSVTDDLRVMVKPTTVFVESGPAGGFLLRAQAGRSLHLPAGTTLRPHPKHLHWHRTKHGFVDQR